MIRFEPAVALTRCITGSSHATPTACIAIGLKSAAVARSAGACARAALGCITLGAPVSSGWWCWQLLQLTNCKTASAGTSAVQVSGAKA